MHIVLIIVPRCWSTFFLSRLHQSRAAYGGHRPSFSRRDKNLIYGSCKNSSNCLGLGLWMHGVFLPEVVGVHTGLSPSTQRADANDESSHFQPLFIFSFGSCSIKAVWHLSLCVCMRGNWMCCCLHTKIVATASHRCEFLLLAIANAQIFQIFIFRT